MSLTRHAVNESCTPNSSRAVAKLNHLNPAWHGPAQWAFGLIATVAFCFTSISGTALAQQDGSQALPVGQPIAILETVTPVPLTCSDNECVATLSSISLDEYGPLPVPDQAFALLEGDGEAVLLSSGGENAESVSFDQIDLARILADRAYSRVKISIPETSLLGAGLATDEIAVSVSRMVAGRAIEDELAYAKGAPVAKSQISFDGVIEFLSEPENDRQAGLVAGQLIARTIAELHDDAALSDVESRWARVRAAAAADTAIPKASLELADGAFTRCADTIDGLLPTETCLWSHHDGFVSEVNRAYWRAIGAGA